MLCLPTINQKVKIISNEWDYECDDCDLVGNDIMHAMFELHLLLKMNCHISDLGTKNTRLVLFLRKFCIIETSEGAIKARASLEVATQ